jgi:hypothetical protein
MGAAIAVERLRPLCEPVGTVIAEAGRGVDDADEREQEGRCAPDDRGRRSAGVTGACAKGECCNTAAWEGGVVNATPPLVRRWRILGAGPAGRRGDPPDPMVLIVSMVSQAGERDTSSIPPALSVTCLAPEGTIARGALLEASSEGTNSDGQWYPMRLPSQAAGRASCCTLRSAAPCA